MPGGVYDSSHLVGGDDSELTTKTMIRRVLSSGDGRPASCSASRTSSASSHAAHAHVVRHAAVDQMEERSTDAVAVGLQVLERSYRPRGRSRRVVVVEEQLRPSGRRLRYRYRHSSLS